MAQRVKDLVLSLLWLWYHCGIGLMRGLLHAGMAENKVGLFARPSKDKLLWLF